jgi:phage shock protein PspC (stress-responsive transcriptional regulator)
VDQQPGGEPRRSGSFVLGGALVLLGFYLLVRAYAHLIPGYELVAEIWDDAGWPLAIIAIGIALIVGTSRRGFSLPGRQTRLTRSQDHKVIAGVLGGLAEYLSADPALVRLLYVGFALLADFGTALLLYIVLAFVVPEEDTAASGTAER